MTIGRRAFTVIGVVRDFHQTSLHRPIEPMILRNGSNSSMCVRIDPRADGRETLAFLESTVKKFSFVPDQTVSFEFLDDRVDGFYAAERKVEAVLHLFTAVALFTACLGLLGLASFLAEKRTREIGLRKIMGARISSLVGLQAREFAKWILAAGLIAGPAAYYAGERWLRSFAYRTDLPIGLFLLSILGALAAALLTVGFQSLRAALARPAEALRHE
jgi:putative ABC transport system permease protein